MVSQNNVLEVPLWYGNKDKDIITIQQWLDIVQNARGKYQKEKKIVHQLRTITVNIKAYLDTQSNLG